MPEPQDVFVDAVVAWHGTGRSVFSGKDVASARGDELTGSFLVWVHVRMPEVDTANKRTVRARWEPVWNALAALGSTAAPRPLHPLAAPMSSKFDVMLAFGGVRIEATDPERGRRNAFRASRIALLAVDQQLLVSARHRDGLIWLDQLADARPAVLRESAGRKRDPYKVSSLLATLDKRSAVDSSASAKDLANELILAVTRSYARLLDDAIDFVRQAETRLSAVSTQGPSADSNSHDARSPGEDLLTTMVGLGQLEGQLRRARADADRVGADPEGEIVRNFGTAIDGLDRVRSEARALIDMIASTVAGEQLQLARSEAKSTASLTRGASILASTLLVPTLVAGLFGANVVLPRSESVWGTWLMLSVIVAAGSGTYALLLGWTRAEQQGESSGETTSAPYLVSAVAAVVALLIAVGAIGSDPARLKEPIGVRLLPITPTQLLDKTRPWLWSPLGLAVPVERPSLPR